MEMSVLQVIAESEQLRMDSDDLGPRAELDYWKKRMSCCNYLLDQIKSPEVSTVFGVLLMSKSKLIKVRHLFYSWKLLQDCVSLLTWRCVSLQTWQELDTRITDVFNEAKDNVKYLYSLEKYYDPLYNSDPVRKVFLKWDMFCCKMWNSFIKSFLYLVKIMCYTDDILSTFSFFLS